MELNKLIGARYYPIGSEDTGDPRNAPWNIAAAQGGKWNTPVGGGMALLAPGAALASRRPKRGPYNEADQSVMDDQFREAKKGGFDYFSTCWFASAARKKPVQDAAINGMAASTVQGAKFHIAFDSNTPSDRPVTKLDDVRNIAAAWDDLFKSPNYVRLDGRPVVDIIKLDDFDQVVAPAAGLTHKALLDFLRKWTKEDIYFAASGLALPHWLNTARNAGYNAYTAYNRFTTWSNRDSTPVIGPNPTTFSQLAANLKNEWTYLLGSVAKQANGQQVTRGVLQDYGMEYILDMMSGFDDTPWFPSNTPVGIATEAELAAHAADGYAFAKMDRVRMICWYAWNEWLEGGFLEPSYMNGRMCLGVLDAARGQL